MELFGYTFIGIYKYLICAAIALILGIPVAVSYTVRNKNYSKSYIFSLYALPIAVMTVLWVVGDHVGAAVTVAGAFALIRFRSLACTARELINVFMSMIVGAAVANAGQLSSSTDSKESLIIALVFTVLDVAINIVFNCTNIALPSSADKMLKITIPESLDYTEVFDDLFEKYTSKRELVRVKTTNMGSMFQLTYQVTLKDVKEERAFLNDLRCRNGNLDIILSKVVEDDDRL